MLFSHKADNLRAWTSTSACCVALSRLAEHRSFARAAKAVHISQPALSRSIQELEQRAGTRLFDRTSLGAEPTAAGALFLEHARDVMSRASDLGREMDLLKGLETGELRIGAGTYPSNMYVDQAIGRLLREHPSVKISISNDNWSNLLPLLRKRELDLAIIEATTAEAEPEMHVIRLSTHQGYLVLASGPSTAGTRRFPSKSKKLGAIPSSPPRGSPFRCSRNWPPHYSDRKAQPKWEPRFCRQ